MKCVKCVVRAAEVAIESCRLPYDMVKLLITAVSRLKAGGKSNGKA